MDNLPLPTRRGADNDEADETQDRCGAEGEDRLGGAEETESVADLAVRHQVHPNQIYAWKKQLQDQAARAFDTGTGEDAEVKARRKIDELHAKIGELTVERDFLSGRSGR